MPLAASTRLGPYEVLGLVGAGGMGEVYKARDTRLDRTVAIKILPPDVSADPDRRARFEREAKSIAGLAHPHICTLHDVGEHDGSMFLVLEHLEGQTLAERLEKGPLPIEQALRIATEIADALSAAHRHGIIHRDLKPGNVMVTKSGAKLLDFGLAKLTGRGEQGALAPLVSGATQTAPLTSEGLIAGTLQYMAPEQLEGRPADARTDLWALGGIIYEMVAGTRAFKATSAASLIGAILEREPDSLVTLQPLTPPVLDRLVRQCLAKVPDERPDTAHDVANDLRWLGEAGSVVPFPRSHRTRGQLLRVVAGVGLGAMSGAGAMWLLGTRSVQPVVRSELSVRPAEELNAGGTVNWIPTAGGSRTALTWTPDGRSIVFVGRKGGLQHLYVRAINATEASPLAGTEGAHVPAVSADGKWVAFWASKALKKVPLAGGPVMELASGMALPPRGLVWDGRNNLWFCGFDGGPLWLIPEGGSPKPVTTLDDMEGAHVPSSVLPGNRAILYTARRRVWTWGDEEVVALEPATGKRTALLHDAADARYVPTGHLVFLRRGVLLAVAFDAGSLRVGLSPVPVTDGVAQALAGGSSIDVTGAGQYAVATTGSLAWIPGTLPPNRDTALVTVDQRGGVSALKAPLRNYAPFVRVSPDGDRLLVMILGLAERGLWLYDQRRAVLTPLHRRGEVNNPLWSRDGRHVVFRWLNEGRFSLLSQSADGSAPVEVLATNVTFIPSAWTHGGDLLGLQDRDLAVSSTKRPIAIDRLQETPDTELWPELSPDGRWLVYGSNASGRMDIYVRPYAREGGGTVVSQGASSPAWHPNGREIFYVVRGESVSRMMVVHFDHGLPPRIGGPRLLFEFNGKELLMACEPWRCYDVAPDGQQFYTVRTPAPPPPPVITHINLIQNWFEELKTKVPVGK